MTTRRSPGPRVSARWRLALSYAAFLVAAGAVTLFGVYVVLRYVPDYPLTAAMPRTAPGDPRLVGTPLEAVNQVASRSEILGAVTGVSGLLLLGLAVVGVGGGWLFAGWVLRPLQRINDAASSAATGALDHRVALTGRNDEFQQLADTFDHMLDRLQEAFETQERFAANASHELRTPLTVMATMLDVARKDPAYLDDPTLIDRLRITNARAIDLTEALLRLADSGAVREAFEPVDLAVVVQDAVDGHAAEARAADVRLETHLEATVVQGDAPLLERLVWNLVQNGVRHNVAGGFVRVACGPDPRGAGSTLRVENGGRTYTPDEAARLTEPFLRGAGRVARPVGRGGYGLGLALVARIVDAHAGALTIAPRPGGGLVVSVALPGP